MALVTDRRGWLMHCDTALELVGSIYDAAFEPKLWPQVMTRLADLMGGMAATLHFSDTATGRRAVVAPRTDPDYLVSYGRHWVNVNPLLRHCRAVPVGKLIEFAAFMPRGEFEHTAFYNEWWAPQGLGTSGLGVNLMTSDKIWAGCAIHPATHRSFKPEADALFSLLCPHLVRAFSLQRGIAHLVTSQHANAGSPRPGKGAVCVDRDANIVFADDEAETVIRSAPELGFKQGRLRLTRPDAAAALDRLIASCTDPALRASGPGGSIDLPRTGGRPPLRVEVLPVRMTAEWIDVSFFDSLRPVAILTIHDPEREVAERMTELQEKFGLTPAEAAFTLEILKGDGRAAAAARSGITLSTARTHLTRIFEKVGVRRQAALVRLLADRTGDGRHTLSFH